MEPDGEDGLEHLLVEARGTIRAQERAIASIDEKAANLLRFNALIIGLVVTATTLFAGGPRMVRMEVPTFAALLGGLVALIASTTAAILAFRTKEFHVGLHAQDLVDAVDMDPSRDAVCREATRAHASAILENSRALDRAVRRVDIALWALLAGVLALAAATVSLLLNNAPRWF